MKIEYRLHEQRAAQGTVDLDLDRLAELEDARDEDERRAVMEAAVWEHARMENQWMYGRQVDFGIVPEDEE